MKVNPYAIPDDGRWRTINVSGGQSSAYLLKLVPLTQREVERLMEAL